MNYLSAVSLLVRDYDEAIGFYVGKLGFELVEDANLGGGKRCVRVRPRGGEATLLLAKATTAEQQAAVGAQAGGRVWLFLETDDFDRDHLDPQPLQLDGCLLAQLAGAQQHDPGRGPGQRRPQLHLPSPLRAGSIRSQALP